MTITPKEGRLSRKQKADLYGLAESSEEVA